MLSADGGTESRAAANIEAVGWWASLGESCPGMGGHRECGGMGWSCGFWAAGRALWLGLGRWEVMAAVA